jgi:hypothetical protein
LQGANNALLVRQLNTLKRELTKQNDQLLINHQDEDIVDGGEAKSIQFHFLLQSNTDELDSAGNSATLIAAGQAYFDGNGGATGTSDYVFNLRRDILKRENLRNF